MKLYVNLIPALAYAMVTFFSNMAGLTSEVAKSQEKQQLVSQPALHQESVCRKNFVWVPNNEQNIASNDDGDADLAWRIPYSLTGMNMHSSLLIRRYVLLSKIF
jgi:hypothetical protein